MENDLRMLYKHSLLCCVLNELKHVEHEAVHTGRMQLYIVGSEDM